VKWIFLLKDGKETITAEDLALLKEKLNAFVFDAGITNDNRRNGK
jgi:cysteinyl-tRNA synthetase